MMRPRIVITNPVHPPVLDLLQEAGEVVANASIAPWTRAELSERIAGASAIMASCRTVSTPICSPRRPTCRS